MVKLGTIKPALLLALVAVTVIALAEPIAGDTMGQGNMMDQQNTIVCPDNQTGAMMHYGTGNQSANETMMHCMMQHHCMMEHHCMMGNDSMNETMMHSMMGDCPDNRTMMHHCMHHCMHGMMNNDSMMDNCSMNETMMPCMMGNDSMNETMMHCMMEDHMMNESCCMMGMGKNVSATQEDIDCAHYNMDEAIKIHEMHLINPNTSTEESNMEMMDHMMQAYECITGENLTSEMMMDCEKDSNNKTEMKEYSNKTMVDCKNDSASKAMMEEDSENETMMHCCMMSCMMEDHAGNKTMMPCMMEDHTGNESRCLAGMDQNTSSAHVNLCCASFWLKEAIELHEMHMKDPSTMTEESQKELMCQMLRADMCITGKSMTTMDMMDKETDNISTEWVTETAAYLSM